MRMNLIVWAVTLLSTLSTLPVQAQSSPLAPLLPTQASLSRLKLTRMWWGNATLNVRRDKLAFLSLDGDRLFAHSTSGILTCFDSETGRKLWSCSLGGEDEPAFPPASNDTLVIIPSGNSLIALNKRTGDIVWRFGLPRSPTASPIVDDTQVYIPTSDRSVMAFELTQLSKFYDRRLSGDSTALAVRWKYAISNDIENTPVQSGDLLSWASTGRTTYTVSRNRDLKYTFDTPANVSAGLTSYNGMLFICSSDARIFALDVVTGSLRWQTVVGSPIVDTPRVVMDDLFVTPQGIGMFRLRAKDGIELWQQPSQTITNFVGASTNAIYGSDRAMNLVRVSRATGELQGRLPLDRFTLRVANDMTDRLFLATPTGTIIALREHGHELPLYFRYPERLPIMPEFAPEDADVPPAEGTSAEQSPDASSPADTESTESELETDAEMEEATE